MADAILVCKGGTIRIHLTGASVLDGWIHVACDAIAMHSMVVIYKVESIGTKVDGRSALGPDLKCSEHIAKAGNVDWHATMLAPDKMIGMLAIAYKDGCMAMSIVISVDGSVRIAHMAYAELDVVSVVSLLIGKGAGFVVVTVVSSVTSGTGAGAVLCCCETQPCVGMKDGFGT